MNFSKICFALCIVIATLALIEAKKDEGSKSKGSNSSEGKSKGSSKEKSKGSKGSGSNENSQMFKPTSCKPCKETCECLYDVRKRVAECTAHAGIQIPPEISELALESLNIDEIELKARTCMQVDFGYTQKYWDCDATCAKVKKSIAKGKPTKFSHVMPAFAPRNFIRCFGYNINSCLDGCTFRQHPELEESVTIKEAVDVCMSAAAQKAGEDLPEHAARALMKLL